MAVQTGTATDYLDLLDALRTFMLANGWTSLRWSGASEFIAVGEGLGATDEIYVGINGEENSGEDWFNWQLNGMTGFESGLDFNAQPGNIGNSLAANLPRMHLWNSSIPYWFVVNARRVIVVAKISTVYQLGYLGWINPYLPAVNMPYPMLIAGTSTASNGSRWSHVHDTHSFGVMQPVCANGSSTENTILTNPRSSARFWFGEWHGVQNYYNSSLSNATRWKTIWPYVTRSGPHFSSMRTNPVDAGYVLTPVIVNFTSPSKYVFGELDGIFHVSGFSNAAENIITIGADDYLVVQNVYRNTIGDYCAVKLA